MAQWFTIGSLADLQANSGVCALVHGQQIALFYLPKDNIVYAIDNYDPIGQANVLSRGIIGNVQGHLVLASPLYKEHYDLQTGVCLEDESIRLKVYAAKLEGDRVLVCL